jgi:hypothetical protein
VIPDDDDRSGEIGRQRGQRSRSCHGEDDLVDDGSDGMDGVMQQRDAVELGGELVRAEAPRASAGEDDGRCAGRGQVAALLAAAADPGRGSGPRSRRSAPL